MYVYIYNMTLYDLVYVFFAYQGWSKSLCDRWHSFSVGPMCTYFHS